ncbi:MAG: hypothetical protein P8X64_11910 [Anaerolineales bacterium]
MIYISSIVTFSARMLVGTGPGHWIGIPILLMAFPLAYLLIKAPSVGRPPLYYLQVGLMLLWIITLFLIDYVFHFDFRSTNWMVITYVVFYFAAIGGMLGVTSLAGRKWMLSGVVLFLVAGVLSFVQRAVTGY